MKINFEEFFHLFPRMKNASKPDSDCIFLVGLHFFSFFVFPCKTDGRLRVLSCRMMDGTRVRVNGSIYGSFCLFQKPMDKKEAVYIRW